MIELDSEVVKSGSDAWRQSISLVTQAISTHTTHRQPSAFQVFSVVRLASHHTPKNYHFHWSQL
jgi:hypothetical protein